MGIYRSGGGQGSWKELNSVAEVASQWAYHHATSEYEYREFHSEISLWWSSVGQKSVSVIERWLLYRCGNVWNYAICNSVPPRNFV